MANIFQTPQKVQIKRQLFHAGELGLEAMGYGIHRIPGAGKASLRQIRRGSETKTVTIRTSQDQWWAFGHRDGQFITLPEADLVVVASVDDVQRPRFALVHLIPGDDARSRFERKLQAEIAAGRHIESGNGPWVSLYKQEEPGRVDLVGAGAGLAFPAVLRVPLRLEGDGEEPQADTGQPDAITQTFEGRTPAAQEPVRSTPAHPYAVRHPILSPQEIVQKHKRILAQELGVPETSVQINVSF